MDAEDLIEAFEALPDWEDRYELISDLGARLPPMPSGARSDANLVKGCNTRAWLAGRLSEDTPPRVIFDADAETPLVRGLVALLLAPYRGKTPEEVLQTDPRKLYDVLGIESALSPSRRAGMHALLARVREIAIELAGGSTAARVADA
jgi:cysteine desulfuration protein SufE